jgi:hypothetical protein
MKLLKITSSIADKISAVESLVYPEPYRLGERGIRENLYEMEKNKCNFSWATLDKDGNINAYLIAYLDNSHREQDEPVIYIDDIVITESAKKTSVYFLLKAMINEYTSMGLPLLPIEGVSRENAHNMWSRHGHSRTIAKLGYHMTDSFAYFDEDMGSELYWVRFESAG